MKNKEALRQAFIGLALERGFDTITVTELTKRARVNRMTFYAHYDDLKDIVAEFTDDMLHDIMASLDEGKDVDIAGFLSTATALMEREQGFFALVARDDRYAFCRNEFRAAFKTLLREELEKIYGDIDANSEIMADMLASGITYAYLDWLAGKYKNVPLSAIVDAFELLVNKTIASRIGS